MKAHIAGCAALRGDGEVCTCTFQLISTSATVQPLPDTGEGIPTINVSVRQVPDIALYTQSQLDAAVQVAVEKERDRLDLLRAMFLERHDLGAPLGRGGLINSERIVPYDWYNRLYHLVSSELPQETP